MEERGSQLPCKGQCCNGSAAAYLASLSSNRNRRCHCHCRCAAAGPNGEFPRLLKTDGRTTIVYPMGEWLTPCGFSSGDCHKDFLLTRAAGDTNLTRLVGSE